MSDAVIERGIISGRMPGGKDWSLFFLELTSTHLHIFEGHEQSSLSRKHLRSVEIRGNVEVGEKKANKKNIFKFYLSNADGHYVFQLLADLYGRLSDARIRANACAILTHSDFHLVQQCGSENERDKWINKILKVKNQSAALPKTLAGYGQGKRVVQPRLPQPPTAGSYSRDSRSSVSSTDSGLGPSTDGEISRPQFVAVGTKQSLSTPSSADGSVEHTKSSKSHSDGGCFSERIPPGSSNGHENFDNYSWFWDTMSRADTEKKLQTEGKVGNFVVRVNAEGRYVMSVWRADAVHHYKILQSGNMWKFERAAIQAEGTTLVDLLDTYMKTSIDKSVVPFGDGLHLVYDEPWNPPEVDMNQLSERLREEFTKSTSLESSMSRTDPSQKNPSPASTAKPKKTVMVPAVKQSSASPQRCPSSKEESRATAKSPTQKSDSASKLNSSIQQLIISSKPVVKPKPSIPPTATVLPDQDEGGVYQNWSVPSPQAEELSSSYENWTAGEQSPSDVFAQEDSEQIYQNTIQKPTFAPPQVTQKPQVSQRPVSKR